MSMLGDLRRLSINQLFLFKILSLFSKKDPALSLNLFLATSTIIPSPIPHWAIYTCIDLTL